MLIPPTFTLVTLWRSLSSTKVLPERNLSYRKFMKNKNYQCAVDSDSASNQFINLVTTVILLILCFYTCNEASYQHAAYHGRSSMISMLHWMRNTYNHVMLHKHLKTTPSRCLHVELIGSVSHGPLNMWHEEKELGNGNSHCPNMPLHKILISSCMLMRKNDLLDHRSWSEAFDFPWDGTQCCCCQICMFTGSLAFFALVV